jgi:hypothetical protein
VSKPIVPLVNIKIAGKWMFIPLNMVLICIDPYPCHQMSCFSEGNNMEKIFFQHEWETKKIQKPMGLETKPWIGKIHPNP